jgi:hypothetical protein
LSGASDVAEHLLHVYVLVPELVHSLQERHRTVPNIARVVDELVLHLYLDIALLRLRRRFLPWGRPQLFFGIVRRTSWVVWVNMPNCEKSSSRTVTQWMWLLGDPVGLGCR